MSWFRNVLFRVGRTSAVRRIRRVVGQLGAPGLNPQFEAIRLENAQLRDRIDAVASTLSDVQRHMPAVLSAIQSTPRSSAKRRSCRSFSVSDVIGRTARGTLTPLWSDKEPPTTTRVSA